MDVDRLGFAAHYRGPHTPEDALHWLDHPDQPGPTGAPPPHQDLLDLAHHWAAVGDAAAADAALAAGVELLAHHRRQTLAAVRACHGDAEDE